jgi:hypothetical protein
MGYQSWWIKNLYDFSNQQKGEYMLKGTIADSFLQCLKIMD